MYRSCVFLISLTAFTIVNWSSAITAADDKLPFKMGAAEVVRLSLGPNWVDINEDGRKDMIFMARRENYNAHSFVVFAVYMQVQADSEEPVEWHIVPWFDRQGGEHEEISTHGGADCQLEDMRIVKVKEQGHSKIFLLLGKREYGKSFVDEERVSFDVYKLTLNEEQSPGRPVYYFNFEISIKGRAKYCDINQAFDKELKLSDYMNRE